MTQDDGQCYRQAAEDTLQQLDWCTGYLHGEFDSCRWSELLLLSSRKVPHRRDRNLDSCFSPDRQRRRFGP